MKVTLTETGGWANARRSCTVDTANLPRPVAVRLEDGCRLALAAKGRAIDPAVRDGRTLTIIVDAGGDQWTASFSEPGTPLELRPVLEILRPLCRLQPVVGL